MDKTDTDQISYGPLKISLMWEYNGGNNDLHFLLMIYWLLWCWRGNIAALGINTMRADALAPKVARTSAGMVLAV